MVVRSDLVRCFFCGGMAHRVQTLFEPLNIEGFFAGVFVKNTVTARSNTVEKCLYLTERVFQVGDSVLLTGVSIILCLRTVVTFRRLFIDNQVFQVFVLVVLGSGFLFFLTALLYAPESESLR